MMRRSGGQHIVLYLNWMLDSSRPYQDVRRGPTQLRRSINRGGRTYLRTARPLGTDTSLAALELGNVKAPPQ